MLIEKIKSWIENTPNIKWGETYNAFPNLSFEIKDISQIYLYNNTLMADLEINVNKNFNTFICIKVLEKSNLLKDILNILLEENEKKIILLQLNDVSRVYNPNNGEKINLPSNKLLKFKGGDYKVKFIDNYLSEEQMNKLREDPYYDHSQAMILTNIETYDSFKLIKINYLVNNELIYKYDHIID